MVLSVPVQTHQSQARHHLPDCSLISQDLEISLPPVSQARRSSRSPMPATSLFLTMQATMQSCMPVREQGYLQLQQQAVPINVFYQEQAMHQHGDHVLLVQISCN